MHGHGAEVLPVIFYLFVQGTETGAQTFVSGQSGSTLFCPLGPFPTDTRREAFHSLHWILDHLFFFFFSS